MLAVELMNGGHPGWVWEPGGQAQARMWRELGI